MATATCPSAKGPLLVALETLGAQTLQGQRTLDRGWAQGVVPLCMGDTRLCLDVLNIWLKIDF